MDAKGKRKKGGEEVVLCAASAYEKKFYLNPYFSSLPEEIRKELKVMCVLFTEDVGGILMLAYDRNGNLKLNVQHIKNDFSYDEIGCSLKIKQLQRRKSELFAELELFFRVFYLGGAVDASDD